MSNNNDKDDLLSILNSCYTQIVDNIEKQITNNKDSSNCSTEDIHLQLNQHIQKLDTYLYNIKTEVRGKENSGSKLDVEDPNKVKTDILLQKIEKLEKENEELKIINNEQFSLLNDIKISVEQLKDEKAVEIKSNIEFRTPYTEINEDSLIDVSNTSMISEFINSISDIKMGIVTEYVILKVEDKIKPIENDKLIDLYAEPERIYLTETMLLNQSLKKILKEKKDINDSYKTPKTQLKSLIPSKYTSNTICMKNEKKKLFVTPQNSKKIMKNTSPSTDKENIYPIPSKIPKGLTPSGKNKIIKTNRSSISKPNNTQKGCKKFGINNGIKIN